MYRYQTFGSRFLASLIDGVVLYLLSLIIFKIFKRYDTNTIAGSLIDDGLFYFYSIFLHYKFGQTFGKKITNVKVVSNTDETKLIGIVNSIKRDSIGIFLVLLEILLRQFNVEDSSWGQNFILFSSWGWVVAELVSMLFNKKRRAIHDFLANSVVIDVKKYTEAELILLNEK